MPKVRAKTTGEYPVNQWRQPGDVFDYQLGKGETLPNWLEQLGGAKPKAAQKAKAGNTADEASE